MGRRRHSVASVDVDCLDTALVPGSGWPEPGGFLPCEVLKFLQIIADSTPVAGIEIVECSPPYESAEITRLNSTRVIWNVLAWQCASAICRADTSREKFDWTRYDSLQIPAFVATVAIPAK